MYRITFNPTTAVWNIQLQTFGIFWVRVQTRDGGIAEFHNFDAAEKYVREIGLGKVYRNARDTAAAQIWQGGYQPNPPPVQP